MTDAQERGLYDFLNEDLGRKWVAGLFSCSGCGGARCDLLSHHILHRDLSMGLSKNFHIPDAMRSVFIGVYF